MTTRWIVVVGEMMVVGEGATREEAMTDAASAPVGILSADDLRVEEYDADRYKVGLFGGVVTLHERQDS
jgi:hypothetical protein